MINFYIQLRSKQLIETNRKSQNFSVIDVVVVQQLRKL